MKPALSEHLVQITTSDKLVLPGVLFEPGTRVRRAILYLHGNGSSSTFYSLGSLRYETAEWAKVGCASLAFNTRGAYMVHTVKTTDGKRVPAGTAYELLKDCVKDIDAAVAFLKKRGYSEIYLLGFSTGANKICVYNWHKPNNGVAGYILASGGDDTGIEYRQLGRARFMGMVSLCRRKIKQGRGMDLIPYDRIGKIYSFRSYYDTINPDGEYNTFPYLEYFGRLGLSQKKLFWQFSAIKKPTLVVYGDRDEYGYRDMKRVMRVLSENCSDRGLFSFSLVPGADHGFNGKKAQFAAAVKKWLSGLR